MTATASGRLGCDLTVDLNQRRDRWVMISMPKPGKRLFEKGLEFSIGVSRAAGHELSGYRRQRVFPVPIT